jgi:hypothetical protein
LLTGDWPRYHPRPFHPALAIVVRRDPPSPVLDDTVLDDTVLDDTVLDDNTGRGAAPDGYRRTLSYRAGVTALTGQGFFFRSLMSSHYPKRAVYNADAACALPGVLTEMLVDSVPADEARPGRIELLPALPAFLPSGRLSGARTLLGVRVAELRWDTVAGRAEAVLLSQLDREAYVSCWRQAAGRPVRLPAGTPVRLAWGHDEG